MNRINISKNQFSDLLNLINGVFLPLKNFINKKEFMEIIKNNKYQNNFFTIPVFFGVNKKIFNKIKNSSELDLYYKKKYLIKIFDISYYTLSKKLILKRLYGKNYIKHPYSKKFINENYRFLSFKFKKPNYNNLKHKHFISPKVFKKKFDVKKIKKIASFHTRNVPHNAHQWIHRFLYKKFGSLLIQPLIGQYKKGEYKDDIILKTNNLAAACFRTSKVFSIPFFSYPRYAGYREAAFHAIVRKNYGCNFFWVGRDHAGYKNFFGYDDSRKFCFKNQSKLGIKIITDNEPYYCKNCMRIKNTNCTNLKCSTRDIIKISGSLVRNLLKKNKKIPKYLMDTKISNLISKNSLVK